METIELVLSKILPVAFTIFVPILLLLAAVVSKKINDYFGIKNKQAVDEAVMGIVSQAVAYSEQIASNLAKKQEELHGQDKLNIALDYALEQLQKAGIVETTSEELTKKIEAMLGGRIVDIVPTAPEPAVGEDIFPEGDNEDNN